VDPRDPLRGDYVRLNYQISMVPLNLFAGPAPTNPPSGTTIFAALAPVGTNEYWEITRASTERFAPAASEVLLRGKTEWTWANGPKVVHATYGIEQFYVAEGTGNPRGKLAAQVVVSESGRASLKELLVDGKPLNRAGN